MTHFAALYACSVCLLAAASSSAVPTWARIAAQSPSSTPGASLSDLSAQLPAAAERFGDWHQRDSEGRWVLAERDLREDPARLSAWVRDAQLAGDGDLLVWLGIGQQYGNQEVSGALLSIGDPRWIAVSVWRRSLQNSHAFGTELQWVQAQPATVHGWILLHREALGEPLFDQLWREVKDSAPDELAAAKLSGPLEVEPFMAVLIQAAQPVAGGPSRPFGERLIAIDGELYDHQVRRAIATLANRREPAPGFGEALLDLARLSRPELAAAAGRAFVQVPSDREATRELFGLAADFERPPALREALFLGASYGADPVAWLHLHEALEAPGDVPWTAAVERLSELGNRFTSLRIERLLAGSERALLSAQVQRLVAARSAIAVRLEAEAQALAELQARDDPAAELQRQQALDRDRARALYAEQLGHPLAAELRAWAER